MSAPWFTTPSKQIIFCEPGTQLIPVLLSQVSSTRKRSGLVGSHPQADFVRSCKTLGRNIRHRPTKNTNREEEPVTQCGSKLHVKPNIEKRRHHARRHLIYIVTSTGVEKTRAPNKLRENAPSRLSERVRPKCI